jgi:hypothetical protein
LPLPCLPANLIANDPRQGHSVPAAYKHYDAGQRPARRSRDMPSLTTDVTDKKSNRSRATTAVAPTFLQHNPHAKGHSNVLPLLGCCAPCPSWRRSKACPRLTSIPPSSQHAAGRRHHGVGFHEDMVQAFFVPVSLYSRPV